MFLKKDTKILEIGAAQGLSLLTLSKIGYNCVGIEPSKDAINISKKLSDRSGRKLLGNNISSVL